MKFQIITQQAGREGSRSAAKVDSLKHTASGADQRLQVGVKGAEDSFVSAALGKNVVVAVPRVPVEERNLGLLELQASSRIIRQGFTERNTVGDLTPAGAAGSHAATKQKTPRWRGGSCVQYSEC